MNFPLNCHLGFGVWPKMSSHGPQRNHWSSLVKCDNWLVAVETTICKKPHIHGCGDTLETCLCLVISIHVTILWSVFKESRCIRSVLHIRCKSYNYKLFLYIATMRMFKLCEGSYSPQDNETIYLAHAWNIDKDWMHDYITEKKKI